MTRKIVSISMDELLLLEVDELARKYGLNRSELISETLREASQDREKWELIAENKFLRNEIQRLRDRVKMLERVIRANRYRVDVEPVLVNELEG
jgi:regulator of replication initiation timing